MTGFNDIPESDLMQGTVYVYDVAKLERAYGGTSRALDAFTGMIGRLCMTLEGLLVKAKRREPYVVWMLAKSGVARATGPEAMGMMCFITPNTSNLVLGSLSLPRQLAGFIAMEEGSPLWEGATPIRLVSSEGVRGVYTDEDLLTRLAELRDKNYASQAALAGMTPVEFRERNPYRIMLENGEF